MIRLAIQGYFAIGGAFAAWVWVTEGRHWRANHLPVWRLLLAYLGATLTLILLWPWLLYEAVREWWRAR